MAINGRHSSRFVPVLGRYILFKIDEQWQRIQHLRGIDGVLLDVEDQPGLVLPNELSRLRYLCQENIVNKRKIGFEYGDRVTPKSGPFAHFVGIFDGSLSKGREVAVFSLFGRESKVVFKRGDLIAA